MIHGRTEFLHQGQSEERLDLTLTLIHTLLADPLGETFHLLLRDIQSGEDLQILAARGERRIVNSRVDNLVQDVGAIRALVNPQTPGLREKKLPGTWGSNASALPSEPGPPLWSRPAAQVGDRIGRLLHRPRSSPLPGVPPGPD